MTEPIGEEAANRIAPAAAALMREAIAGTGGREVFFAGSLDARGCVENVRVCARGTADAVPAFFEMLAMRDVILHNHPTGDITPSNADLDIAAVCAHNGHGVYIVDNNLERVYVVVEPFLDKDSHKLDPAELARALEPGSPLAVAVPQFEVRPQQAVMMEAVARAFNHDGLAVIEAPTGVGKTFAYLIPAVLWSIRNRERVVVSTRTINLQEQIIGKDIPLLQKCLKTGFSAVLVKGRANYLCRRKLDRALVEMSLLDDENARDSLKALADWAGRTEDGSRADLPFMPRREIWERVCSEADTCGGSYCPANKTCFFTKARREIAKADLLIVNHHILFSDISVKKETGDFSALAVLPAYKRVVFDEAHSIEDSATEYFGVQATRAGALALLGRFIRRERTQERGLLPFIKLKLIQRVPGAPRELTDAILDLIDNRLFPALAAVREAVTGAFDALREFAAARCRGIGRDIKWRLTEEALQDPELRELHETCVVTAVEEAGACVQLGLELCVLLKKLRAAHSGEEPPLMGETIELQAYVGRLEHLRQVLLEATSGALEPNTVRWVELDATNRHIVRVVRCPLDVGKCLAEWVYPNLKTVVMTSATLTVQRRFDFFAHRVGLDLTRPDRIETAILDTPFDFLRQALFCITRDMLLPDDPRFLDETAEALREILRISQGHALALFTSFYALDFVHNRLEAGLRAVGILPLKQGEASRTQTLDRFRRDAGSVLFATDSFWEGVDVAGEALQCVILPRLPFRVPTEPIQEARAEAVQAAGGNAFVEYTLPQAVIKFRQGFGRLIRRKTDRGVIVVLDRRLLTRFYGKAFTESLPGVPVVAGSRAAVYEALEGFFAGKESDHDEAGDHS